MIKHKLDEEVEDILQHYGIEGMKWNVRRSPEEIKADLEAGVNAVGEALDDAGDEVLGNDSVMGELGDVLDVIFGGKGNLKKETKQLVDASKDKLEDISKDVKKRGYKLLERMFGTTAQANARDKAEKKKFLKGIEAGWKDSGGKVIYPGDKNKSSRPKRKSKNSAKGLLSKVDKDKLRNR